MIKIIKNGVVVSVILDTRTINKEGTYPVKSKCIIKASQSIILSISVLIYFPL